MAAMATNDESALLALPMELLTRITDALEDESLPSIRLTCKTLEGATFSRFTGTFSVSYCCVYYETRWLSLKRFLNGSARLVSALHRVCFTTNPLERFDYSDVQLAPNEDMSMTEAQTQYDTSDPYAEGPLDFFEPVKRDKKPTPALIHSVLFDLMELAPFAITEFDLTNTRHFYDAGITMHNDILLAIATTFCPVGILALSRSCVTGIGDLTAHLGPRLLVCTSMILDFSFTSSHPYDDDNGQALETEKLDFLVSVLQSADNLSSLTLDLQEYMHLDSSPSLAKKLLLANDLANLDVMNLAALHVPEKEFCEAIKSCKTELKRLYLDNVQLTELNEGWLAVLQSLTSLPKLQVLACSNLTTCEAKNHRLDFGLLKDSPEPGSGLRTARLNSRQVIYLDTKEEVAAGLRKLLGRPLSFLPPRLMPFY